MRFNRKAKTLTLNQTEFAILRGPTGPSKNKMQRKVRNKARFYATIWRSNVEVLAPPKAKVAVRSLELISEVVLKDSFLGTDDSDEVAGFHLKPAPDLGAVVNLLQELIDEQLLKRSRMSPRTKNQFFVKTDARIKALQDALHVVLVEKKAQEIRSILE